MPDRLLLDTMCGKLATYLRMCGYDAAYALDAGDGDSVDSRDAPDDEELLARCRRGRSANRHPRPTKTADRAADAVLLESRGVEDQLRELLDIGVDLSLPEEPTQCGIATVESRPWARLNRCPSTRRTQRTPTSGAASTVASSSGRGATGTTSPTRWRDCEFILRNRHSSSLLTDLPVRRPRTY